MKKIIEEKNIQQDYYSIVSILHFSHTFRRKNYQKRKIGALNQMIKIWIF